ncbi:MAG: lipid-A-disaccharide synthase [Alphaproteobacteria bacterium]|nr:lipid-A-disaccharide synthase [Alphaproteobacteria bacterium]
MTSTDISDRNDPLTILLGAVEPSGDAIGAALMDALRAKAPDIRFIGCGGPLMAGKGLDSLFAIAPLSVMGPIDAFTAFPAALSGARKLAQAAASTHADAAILIDGWGFSRMAATQIKKRSKNTRLIKFVAPQVWASRPQRAKTLADLFYGVLTLFEFENQWLEQEGVATKFVGSPTFQHAAQQRPDGAGFRTCHNVGDAQLLAVLLGSRKGEVNRLNGPFRETVERLIAQRPGLRIVIPVAQAVEKDVSLLMEDWPGDPILVRGDDRFGAFAAADAALATSGTVTTELAIFNTPMICAYRVGPISAAWMRRVITTPYVSLINIAAGRAVIPEFLQENCLPDDMAAALSLLLEDTPARDEQLHAFPLALEKLGVGGPPAAECAAKTILSWIGER